MTPFLDIPSTPIEQARVVVLPVPFEATTSYGQGTSQGPAVLLDTTAQVEFYDEELDATPHTIGIATADPVPVEGCNGETVVQRVAARVTEIVARGQFPLALGGEHTITSGCVKGCLTRYPDVGVLQIDAHADLRNTYHDTPWSHACVMRRIVDMGCPTVGVGIRGLSQEEVDFIREKQLPIWFAHHIAGRNDWMQAAIDALPQHVFVTFDVDGLDPSVIRATGTPVPGGLDWYTALQFLRMVFAQRTVVGADVVELAPQAGDHASDFAAARLAYKLVGYHAEAIARSSKRI